MKKAYLYFLAPLVGVAAFGAVYFNYSSGIEAKEAAAKAKLRQEKEEKVRKENESKKKALDDAIAAQEKRKAEKLAKDIKDQQERDARDAALQVRNKARQDAAKLSDRSKTVTRDVLATKEEIKRIQEDKKRSDEEQAFLTEHVKKAQANVQNLYGVLEKIDAADKAAEAAAKAAAAAAAAAAAKK